MNREPWTAFYFFMDDVFDIVWLKILVLVHAVVKGLDLLFSPLNTLGPAAALFVIVVLVMRFMGKESRGSGITVPVKG